MDRNRDEQRARKWLESQEYTDIRDLSVDGADPPDFVVDGRIGVEVRRLTWMFDVNGKTRGAEEIERPLERTISEVLEAAGAPPGGYSVQVTCYLLGVSLPKRKITEKQIKRVVGEYICMLNTALQAGEQPQSWQPPLSNELVIRFQPFLTEEPGEFIPVPSEAAMSLRGWVDKDAIDNINRCIEEKTEKIKDKVALYPEWWLVLVDRDVLTPDSTDDAWETIRDGLVDTKPWSRIVVLSEVNPSPHVDVI